MSEGIWKFMFNGYAVGCFQTSALPQHDGSYSFMPYLGLGLYKLQNQLTTAGNARCYFDEQGKRTFFTVRPDTDENRLQLSDFCLTPQMSLDSSNQLSSQELAELIVNSLFDAQIINQEHWQQAIAIATQEIDARKNVGDY